MGLQLRFAGVDLDMEVEPTPDELLDIMVRTSRVPLDEVRSHRHRAMFPDPDAVVGPAEPSWPHRLQVGHPMMIDELTQVAAEPLTHHGGYDPDDEFSHRLVSRRLPDVYNSSGHDIAGLVAKWRYNPAFMHPDDLAACGFDAGTIIEIDSGRATILGIVEPADDVKVGVISMAHSFGDAPKHDGDVRLIGSNTGRLSDVASTGDPISGIPWMSAIPVNVRLSDETCALS